MIPDAVIFSDESGQIILTNKTAQQLFQYSETEFLHCNIEMLVPKATKKIHPSLREAFFKNPKPRHLDAYKLNLSAIKKDGSEFSMESALFPLKTENGLLAVNLLRDISIQKKEHQVIEKYAFIDALTGLPNRRYFDDHLQRHAAKARRNQEQLGFLYIDLDKFKPINDNYGHEMGDFVLRTIAARMSQNTRMDDILARIGGDEFALLIYPMTDSDYLNKIAKRLLKACNLPIATQQLSFQLSASIGISVNHSKIFNEQHLFRCCRQSHV